MPRPSGVYPRTHGETTPAFQGKKGLKGLSPYTRGNHTGATRKRMGCGSIPVHTGKPGQRQYRQHEHWVYPRTHGETTTGDLRLSHLMGLSPYTRGNHLRGHAECHIHGSIPVHTGKPIPAYRAGGQTGVYPRTHGETQAPPHFPSASPGLSPYTRGNPPHHYPHTVA